MSEAAVSRRLFGCISKPHGQAAEKIVARLVGGMCIVA